MRIRKAYFALVVFSILVYTIALQLFFPRFFFAAHHIYQSLRDPKIDSSNFVREEAKGLITGRQTLSKPDKTESLFNETKYEALARRSKNNLLELRYAVEKELKVLKEYSPSIRDGVNKFQTRVNEQLQAALIDAEDLYEVNEKKRAEEASDLQNLVQSRLDYLQNPKKCDDAKTFVCHPNGICGFACEIHHLTYCFMVAYQLRRTFIIDRFKWRYYDQWNDLFLPISNTCLKSRYSPTNWKGEEASISQRAITFPVNDGMVPDRPQTGIPADLAPRLLKFHGNPFAWWNGQLVKYLTRLQPSILTAIEKEIKIIEFQTPCVGVHVRRTDKVGTEAAFHSIEEYMKHVTAWYDKLDLRLSKEKPAKKSVRRVYLASDDSSVLPEAKEKYPDYTFYVNSKNSSRYEKNSLKTLLVDIHLLSKCEYLTCTMSSGLCRLVYELMQTRHPDASDFVHSLDDDYYYTGQTKREERALYPHNGGEDELILETGDVLGIAGNHWDGQSKGTRMKTMKAGLYPSYKMEKMYQIVKTFAYSDSNNSAVT